MEFVMQI